ncbi:unnamed protein product [Adineta ricciae]|uniref:Transmembrane protein n=1 Tax=Adineta ricciae TaxID=249248 RepID=A0A815JBM2_ADIRI|nr:unnamed protein product [Adineta ricciae]CAF1375780.1 unnamed protein product [Adineta ricciae]
MLSALLVVVLIPIAHTFIPDSSLFDAYGLKLAANDALLVEAINVNSVFLLRFSPFDYSLTCTIAYNDSNQYIYAVALQSQITSNDSTRFVFIGVSEDTDVPFIGSLTYTGVSVTAYIASVGNSTRRVKFPCTGWQKSSYRIHSLMNLADDLEQTDTNSFFVVTVTSDGRYAYAFTNTFLIIYDLVQDIISTQLANITWPDTSFLPRAVDISQNSLIIVLGYIGSSDTKYTPCAYLLNVTNSILTVVDAWTYTPATNTSWQARLTNWNADIYASKYDLSVSWGAAGDRVLFGLQIMNTIVLVSVDQVNQNFDSASQTLSNGKAVGMGKAVGWLDSDLIIVLVNIYSFNYIWSSSQVIVYNVSNNITFTVLSIFPNIQQTLSDTFGPIILSFSITQNGTVVLLDSLGNYYILLPSSAGSFSDTSSGTSSSPTACIAGTFTSEFGISPCSLCPSGTTTNGLISQSSCVSCSNDSFCSLGAAFGDISTSSALLTNINQARAYPVSPQSIRFDNILIENMFAINSESSNCLVHSPLFWALIVVAVGLFVWILMFIFERYVKNPLGKKTHKQMERFFKKTDLIGEGEMVIGGLFSFAIIVLVVFAYTFSTLYFQRYPIEQVYQGASFACDESLTNAQFSSGLMPIGIPPDDIEQPIFTLLDAQPLILSIDFVNTVFNCTDVTVSQVKDVSLQMTLSSCNDSASTMSLSLALPSHDINLQIALTGTNTIGAFRLSFQGPGSELMNTTLSTSYTLQDLVFSQTLSYNGRLLAQQASCTLQFTKIINRTYPLEEHGETKFSGLWLPTLSTSVDNVFADENEYKYSTSTSTVLSIVISETSSYVLNVQKPITAKQELVFTNLLYTIVCLEIFGLGFLIFKLIVIPFFKSILRYFRQRHRSAANHSSLDKPTLTELNDTHL